jgi:hypothetical protein|tara:strand:+ start:530 stop:1237 length:708 start_codon:yes stop_codon:yes gene_type:complete
MDRVENPELARKVLNHLAEQYNLLERREPNHLSSYVYCLTKGFFDQKKQAIEPSDQEIMLFALGYGLQDVLTPSDAEAPVYKQDGIIYRPDLTFMPGSDVKAERLGEIKTTRRSARRHEENLPETWIDYMKGGCYMRGTTQYDLIVLYLMGSYAPPFPSIMADTITFTEDELQANWIRLMSRKAAYDNALETSQTPTPYQYCYDWECKYCRYRMVCEAITLAVGRDYEEEEQKDE